MTALHTLSREHRLRNVPIGSIESIRIVCRNTGGKRDPRAWKICKVSFNNLGDTWTSNFDFTVEVEPPCQHCLRVECECGDFDVMPDMGDKS